MICGVAKKGNIKTIEPNGSRKPYSIWKNMIYRCYDERDKSYRFYGGVGVRVSDDWLVYENFRRDIETLDGFDEELFYKNQIELDKDYIDKNSKLYSKDTCVWLTPTENKQLIERDYRPESKVRMLALDPDDNVYCVIDIPLFSKQFGLVKSEVYGVISGSGNKTCRGWCFKRVEDCSKVININRDDYRQKRFGPKATKYKVRYGSEEVIFKSVKEASEFLGCSGSLLTQRTRQLGEYVYKEHYKVTRV